MKHRKLLIKIFVTLVCIALISIGIWLLVKNEREKMGDGQSQKKLIKTLKYIVRILNKSDIIWSVTFGTLLGLKREGNPIKNDDDIDILIPIKEKKKLLKLFQKHGWTPDPSTRSSVFVRCNKAKNGMAPIDFYFTKQYNKNGYDICVPHEKFPVKLFPIKQIQWQGLKVNIPQDDIRFLNDFYHTWHIPDKGKGRNKKKPTC